VKVILIFGFVPAGYVGLLVGLELAGVNFMWHSARDLILLLFWSVFLFGIAGAVIASVLTALGWWRNLSADKLVFLILTVLATVFIFIDRFGWCYPCHQFLDKRAPHLIHTPARSFMLTVALAVGCVAAGALIGGVTYVIAKTWNARKVRIGVYGAAISVVAVATIISILSTPDLGVNRHAQGEAGTVTREPGARRVLIIIDDGMTWDQGTMIDSAIWVMGSMLEVEDDVVLYVYWDSFESLMRAQFIRVTDEGLIPEPR